jgi:hypothetical protein
MSEMTRRVCLTAFTFNAVLLAAPGKLIVDGKTVELTHVYARKAPAQFDPKTTSTYVVAADRELPGAVRVDEEALREMGWDGKLTYVEIELLENGIAWSIHAPHLKASLSGSQSPSPYKITVAGDRVRGLVKMGKPGKLGDSEYYFEFPVDAPIEVKAVLPPPTARDKVAAQNSAAAAAYKLFQTAIVKGDKAAIIRGVDPEKAAKVDTPEFPKILKVLQAMQPKDVEVVRAPETGDTAELDVIGGGGKDVGTVKMQRMNGSWVVMRESWRQR